MTPDEKKWLALACMFAVVIFLVLFLTGCGMKLQASWDHKIGDLAYEKDADGSVRATGTAAINASSGPEVTIDRRHFGAFITPDGKIVYPGVR